MSMKRNLICHCAIEGLLSAHHMIFFFLYLRTYNLSVLTYSILENIVTMMVVFHPIYGYISDRFSLFGSRKKSYLILSGMIGTVGYCFVGLTSIGMLPFWSIVLAQLVIESSNSIRLVVVDAINISIHTFRNTEIKNQEQLSSNSALMTVFGVRLIARICSNAFFGFAYTYLGNSFFFCNAIVTLLSIIFSLFTVDLPSPPAKERPGLRQSISVAASTIKETGLQRLIISDFIVSLCPNIEAGLKYFYIGVFSFTNTDLSIRKLVQEACFLLGIFAMGTCLKDISRSWFLKLIYFSIAFWNLALILVIDYHDFFPISSSVLAIGHSGIFSLLLEMKILPLMGIFMENCPKNLEGFFNSWIHLFNNVAIHIGGAFGSFLLYTLNISSSNFSNLGKVVYTRFAVYIVGCLLLLTATIPERKKKIKQIDDEEKIEISSKCTETIEDKQNSDSIQTDPSKP